VNDIVPTQSQRDLTRRLLRFRSLPEKETALALAADLFKSGRYGDARGVAVSAQQGRAGDEHLLVLEARAWYLERDLGRAQQALMEAVRFNPECTEAFVLLGEVMLKRGEPERAVKVLLKALSLEPEDAQINQIFKRATRFADIARSYSDDVTPVGEEGAAAAKGQPEPEDVQGETAPEQTSSEGWVRAWTRRPAAPPQRPSGPARPSISIIEVNAQHASQLTADSDAQPPPTSERSSAGKGALPTWASENKLVIALCVLAALVVVATVVLYLARGPLGLEKYFTTESSRPHAVRQAAAASGAPRAPQQTPAPARAVEAITASPSAATAVAPAERLLFDEVASLVANGELTRAKARWSQAPEAQRKSILGKAAWAHLALAAGRPQEAVAALADSAKAESLPALASVVYGNALLAAGRSTDAASAYHQALRVEPALPEALIARAELAVRGEQVELALDLIERTESSPQTAQRPSNFRARVLTLKGRAYLLRAQPGDPERARESLSQAVALEGVSAEAYFWLGEVQARRRPRAATEAYERYLKLSPTGTYAPRARRAVAPR
jgi:tetratricopeptide (TPR) repeat protein